MFKIIILLRYYGLDDKQLEYQIIDRASFKQFLGLESGDKVPDEKTVWAFRETLTNKGLVEKMLNHLQKHVFVKKISFLYKSQVIRSVLGLYHIENQWPYYFRVDRKRQSKSIRLPF